MVMAMKETWVPYLLCCAAQKKYLVLQWARFVSHDVCNILNSSGAFTHLESMWEAEIPFQGCIQLQMVALLGKHWPCYWWPPGCVSYQGENGGSNGYIVHTGESIKVQKGNKQRRIEAGFVFVRLYSIQSFYDYIYSSVYLCNKLPL